MEYLDKLKHIVEKLNTRFPEGVEPYKITTRLAEEIGEVAREVHHFEKSGVKIEKYGEPNRQHFAKELQDVMRATTAMALYYNLYDVLKESIDHSMTKLENEYNVTERNST
jgi:NTP pyrophosphatase (non-canonical NTP hydrolase)